MNLIIEQGNTLTKIALFEEGQLAHTYAYKNAVFQPSLVEALLRQHPCTNGILSTVIERDEALLALLKAELSTFFVLDERMALPIRIGYETPHTLGRDRIAAVVGAQSLRPGSNVLVIDAGTAITYELLEASGLYVGGNISPGMTTRFRALHHFTQKLPLVSEPEEVPLVGVSTESAIQAGVVNGIVLEMDGYIDRLRLKYPGLLVFLTGGHSFYFERRLKNCIFADINLVLIGLNRILAYNVENK